jgi:hypothetical protein
MPRNIREIEHDLHHAKLTGDKQREEKLRKELQAWWRVEQMERELEE